MTATEDGRSSVSRSPTSTSGFALTAIAEVDVDLVALLDHAVRLHAHVIGIVERAAGLDVELEPVTRAADDLALPAEGVLPHLRRDVGPAEQPARELRALMRADVAERLERVASAAEHDPRALELEGPHLAGLEVVAAADELQRGAQAATAGSDSEGSANP